MLTDIDETGMEMETETEVRRARRQYDEAIDRHREAVDDEGRAAAWQGVEEARRCLGAALHAEWERERVAKQEQKAASQREWAEARRGASDIMAAHEDVLEAYRDRLTKFFVVTRDGLAEKGKEPFDRKPPVGLTLVVAGDPFQKLIAHPRVRHDATGGYLVPEQHSIELFEMKAGTGVGVVAPVYFKKLDFADTGPRAFRLGTIYKSAADDARRVVETIGEFLTDARVVLARGCDHCCICGRSLTDEVSRSRGIGPECFRKEELIAVLLGECKPADAFAAPELVEV
jgi:hypothetical protein